MQVSLVAFYRQKPAGLAGLIDECQRRVELALGPRFRRYSMAQVHATLVGLERVGSPAAPFANRNLVQMRGQADEMNFDGLLRFLRAHCFPFTVQIGGYEDRDHAFASRGKRPYERSFSIQGRNVVLMGWPFADGRPDALYRMRRQVEHFNVLHAYHREAHDSDNDFFLRIGMLDEPASVSDEERIELCEQLREWLAAREALVLTAQLADIYMVAYESEELATETTRAFAMTDSTLTAQRLRNLY